MKPRLGLALALAAGLATAVPATPALADGAASTRNILFGAAAAGAGTYLIIHHNAQVHKKYAEYDRRQAATAAQRDDAMTAYSNERSAYEHEAAVVSAQQREISSQHSVVQQLRHELAMRSGGPVRHVAQATPQHHRSAPASNVRVASVHSAQNAQPGGQLASTSLGWGSF